MRWEVGERSEEVGMRQHKTGKQGMVGGGLYNPLRYTDRQVPSVRLIQRENNK